MIFSAFMSEHGIDLNEIKKSDNAIFSFLPLIAQPTQKESYSEVVLQSHFTFPFFNKVRCKPINSNLIAFWIHENTDIAPEWGQFWNYKIFNILNGQIYSISINTQIIDIFSLTEDFFAIITKNIADEYFIGIYDINNNFKKISKFSFGIYTDFNENKLKRIELLLNLAFLAAGEFEVKDEDLQILYSVEARINLSNLIKKEFFINYTFKNNVLSMNQQRYLYFANNNKLKLYPLSNSSRLKYTFPEGDVFIAFKSQVLAAQEENYFITYNSNQKCLSIYKKEKETLILVKSINNVIEVSRDTLPNGNIVFSTADEVCCLNLDNFSSETLAKFKEEDNTAAFSLQVMPGGTVARFKKKTDNKIGITIYHLNQPYKNYHEEIYQIANTASENIEEAKLQLEKLLSDKEICIDTFDRNGMTAAERLAQENNADAVNLLYHFGANINHIATGIAMGGHSNWAMLWLADQNKKMNVNYICMGAATLPNSDWMFELINKYKACVNHAALYAASVNSPAVKVLIEQYHANLNYIALGYAKGGFVQQAEDLRKNYMANKNHIALGAAMHPNIDYAEKLRVEFGASPLFLALGAAIAGNWIYANFLHRIHGAGKDIIMAGAAYRGDFKLVKFPCNLQMIFAAVQIAGHDQYIARFSAKRAERASLALGGHLHLFDKYVTDQLDSYDFAFVIGGHYYCLSEQLKRVHFENNLTNVVKAGHWDIFCKSNNQHKEVYLREIIMAGHYYFAETLLNKSDFNFRAVLSSLLIAAYESNPASYKAFYRHRLLIEILTDCVEFDYLTYLYHNRALPTRVEIDYQFAGNLFFHKNTLLHAATFIENDKIRLSVVKHYAEANKITVPQELLQQTKALKSYYNYDQFITLGMQEFHVWFLQNNKITDSNLIILIAEFIAPLSHKYLADFFEKYCSSFLQLRLEFEARKEMSSEHTQTIQQNPTSDKNVAFKNLYKATLFHNQQHDFLHQKNWDNIKRKPENRLGF